MWGVGGAAMLVLGDGGKDVGREGGGWECGGVVAILSPQIL